MSNTTSLLNLTQQRLQFIKGSAGDTNSKTFPRKSLGHCATSSISSTYDQADFCVCMMKSLMNYEKANAENLTEPNIAATDQVVPSPV